MSRRSAGSLVLGLAVLLQGCGALIQPGPRVPEVIPAVRRLPGLEGSFLVEKRRPGFVIAAPHGTSDSGTDVIGRDLARLTGWSLVVATGFSHLDPEGRRFNVNRPTESVPGTAARLEGESEEARRVFEAYQGQVAEAAQGALELYVEVHGNGRRGSAGRLEIATVGLTPDDAWRIKTLLELIRDARLGPGDEVPRLDVLVEPLDPVWYRASAAKQSGSLAASPRALHIELPRLARAAYRQVYTELLADFLTQMAALLVPAGR